MITDKFDTKPVELLLNKHKVHSEPYIQEFKGLELLIHNDVFNPALTKVSGFLADNIHVISNSTVLDMFCGSGAMAFLAIQKAKKVIGVDISPMSIRCAQENAERLGVTKKIDFRLGNLWDGVNEDENFDLIIANPPLLPATPENWLERAVADSPRMVTTTKFVQGCSERLKKKGKVLMSFSNACGVYFKNPLNFIEKLAKDSNLKMSIKSELDVEYEIYRILEFVKT